MILSLRAYAAHRKAKGLPGGTLRAVQVAIATGRLSENALTREGKIKSARAADLDWLSSTKAEYVPLTGPTATRIKSRTKSGPDVAASGQPVTAGESAEASSRMIPADPPNELGVMRARHEAARARTAELELQRMEGELVPAKDVEARLADVFLRCRTRLLGIPTRAREQDPTLTETQLRLVEAIIHEALEELATGKEVQ